MKGHIPVPALSVLLAVLFVTTIAGAQPEPIRALERARATVGAADQTHEERQAEVLEAAPGAVPAQPEFTQPAVDLFLDLPGAEVPQTPVRMEGSQTISVDFPQEDVRDIIRSVAELYELNVVIPETLTGSVSIKLRNVTWQQVFNVVLEPLGFTYIIDENIIKIKSREELALEPVETRVFVVDFAKAAEIRSSIEPMIDPTKGGRIQVDVRSNALVITERPSRMNDIRNIIEILDKPTEQVMIESKFVELSAQDSKNLGIDWASLSGWSLQAGPFGRTYDRNNSRENSYNTGSSETLTVGNQGVSFSQTSGTAAENWWLDTVARNDTAVFSAEAFSVVLSALEKKDGIRLVSNPTVVTMNNQQASINIGEEYPIPNYTYNTERGVFEVSGFEWKNIGINLLVTPQINSAGFINMSIEPEISSRTGEVLFQTASLPIITSRKTNSTVTIKSGYTLAIGGLIQNEERNRSSKVPVLGSVPMMGRLFRSDGKEYNQRNLIVFITAKILSASGATYQDVFSPRTLYDMGIKERDLPGYESPAGEKELLDAIQRSRDEVERLQEELQLRRNLKALEQEQTASGQRVERFVNPPEKPRPIRRRFQ